MAVIAGPGQSDRPHWIDDISVRSRSGSPAAKATTIRLIITSSVHLLREGLAATLRGRDGVVVMDVVDLGETDPVAAARLIKAASPATKLVAFPLDEIDERVFACAAAGFSSYVPREGGPDELHRALVDAVEGRMHCAPHIAAAMFNRLAGFLRESELRKRCLL